MSKYLYPEMPADQRLQMLRDNADSIEQTTYERSLTQDELDSKLESLANNLIDIQKEDEILDKAKEEHKSKVKPIKLQNGQLLREIKTRKAEFDGTLFHFADHDTGFMHTYDETGEMIGSRRLRPEERQARLFVAGKAANE